MCDEKQQPIEPESDIIEKSINPVEPLHESILPDYDQTPPTPDPLPKDD